VRCLVCKIPMLIREGKFGPFYYCPNGNHGTISVAKYESIMKQSSRAMQAQCDPLMHDLEVQTIALGGGMLSDLERFYIDSEAYYDNPDDFWQNIRPY